MINVVSNVIHDFFLLFANFFGQFFGSTSVGRNYFIPGIGIGIAISIIFLAYKIIVKIVWGR